MREMHELLLNAWLRLSTSINNARLVSEMTFNESLICNILYNHTKADDGSIITATDLCNMTNMLKSQMNRTLNQLEKKNMITRERSTMDKRQIIITMNLEQCHTYENQHRRILDILDAVIEELGETKTQQTIDTLNQISDIANHLNLGK